MIPAINKKFPTTQQIIILKHTHRRVSLWDTRCKLYIKSEHKIIYFCVTPSKMGSNLTATKQKVSLHFFRIWVVSTRREKGEMRQTDGQILHWNIRGWTGGGCYGLAWGAREITTGGRGEGILKNQAQALSNRQLKNAAFFKP
jgi:hypothetical protein